MFKGRVVNQHEKPISLAAHFVPHYTDEGDKVLVLGSASGSELIGCLELGRSVVGIELDAAQFEACNDRLRAWWTRVTSNLVAWHTYNQVPTSDEQAFGNESFWAPTWRITWVCPGVAGLVVV